MGTNKEIILFALAVVCGSAVSAAAPNIQIISPQNTTYSSHDPIAINITSNETVNFYIKSRAGKFGLLDNYTNSLVSKMFGSRGHYNFTVYANNSNGVASASVAYTINHSSVINVTDCGLLDGTNTSFILQNNISSGGTCITIFGHDNSFDLNGYSISTPERGIVGDCINWKIANGNIFSLMGVETFSGSKCQITNIGIEAGDTGMLLDLFTFSLIENVSIKKPSIGISIVSESSNNIIRNLTLETSKPNSVGFYITTFNSELKVKNSRIENFTHNFLFSGLNDMDIHSENNIADLLSVSPDSAIEGSIRIFKEHVLKINVTDQTGAGIASSVELLDNGVLERTDPESSTYTFRSNPTGHFIVGTDANGTAEAFVTEKLIIHKTESPLATETIDFGPYEFFARSANGINKTGNISVNLNSTLQANFTIALGGTALPQCTIAQMLDLDNNGVVNSKDAQVILRWMIGKPVTVNTTKQCNAINFLPIHS